MAIAVPSDADISAKAVELGFIEAGETISPAVRRRTARLIQDLAVEEAAAGAAANAPEQLLSRYTHDVAGGQIRIDVTFIPTKKETPHG